MHKGRFSAFTHSGSRCSVPSPDGTPYWSLNSCMPKSPQHHFRPNRVVRIRSHSTNSVPTFLEQLLPSVSITITKFRFILVSYRTMPCHACGALPSLAPPGLAMPRRASPAMPCPALPGRAEPCHALPALRCVAPPGPAEPRPACDALPCRTLPSRAMPARLI